MAMMLLVDLLVFLNSTSDVYSLRASFIDDGGMIKLPQWVQDDLDCIHLIAWDPEQDESRLEENSSTLI